MIFYEDFSSQNFLVYQQLYKRPFNFIDVADFERLFPKKNDTKI